jgi:hypothetical protein
MKQKHLLPALLLVLLAGCAAPVPAAPTGTPTPAATATNTPIPPPTTMPTAVPGVLYVDPAMSLGPISPYVYGTNYGPWLAVPADMLDEAFTTGMTIFRFPGGEWGDTNDVRKMQVDQEMAFIAKFNTNATLLFSVRLKKGTPEKAAEWVRYANIEKGYHIKYWNIGNEPTLYTGALGENYDTDRFNQEWRAFALAMKAVDPTIQLVGPELHGTYSANFETNPKDSKGLDWMTEFLKANGDLVDVVSFHRYAFPVNNASGPATIEDLRINAHEMDQTIPYLRDLIHKETGRDLPIAITEFNSHYNKAVGGEATPDSHYNAIWLGDSLGRMIRNGVFMVNHWLLATKSGFGGWGLVTPGKLTPSYYTYQMYKMFGSELVYSSSDDYDVSVYAARRADGTLTILLINLSTTDKDQTLAIAGLPTLAGTEQWLFDPQHNAENMGAFDLPGGAIHLPAQSMTLLVIPQK